MFYEHIVKSFDDELEALSVNIGVMGYYARSLYADCIEAIVLENPELARTVISRDKQLNIMRNNIYLEVTSIIARRQPLAQDLENTLANLKLVVDLERIGDLSKNIAKRSQAINIRSLAEPIMRSLEKFATAVGQQLDSALTAYTTRDEELARDVRKNDEAIDITHSSLFRELIHAMNGDKANTVSYIHFLFCLKNIERIGDHATHIAEAAWSIKTGKPIAANRKKKDTSSYLRDDDLFQNIDA
jgi:phosphate transport system protein